MKKRILGVPVSAFYAVVCVCTAGIIIGSFKDYQISVLLANKTEIGSFFATYGSYFSYCLYPAAGMCLYKGLLRKGEQYRMLAIVLLLIAFFMAVYYSDSYNGSKVRELFSYTAGSSPAGLSICAWLFWAVLYLWVPFVCSRVLNDEDADRLIAVGATILVAGILADNMNLWLKQVASRPRYKYLITLDDPLSEYRNWWEMVPYYAGTNDNFKSWPSGNMTIAAMMYSLPMIMDLLKKRSERKNLAAFLFACAFVVLYGYNRIHMTNHFLSDVCSGTLITYLIYAGISSAFMRAAEKREVSE